MKINFKEINDNTIVVGDIIIANDNKAYIVSKTTNKNGYNIYFLYNLEKSSIEYKCIGKEDFMDYIKTEKGIKRIIPSEKVVLMEE